MIKKRWINKHTTNLGGIYSNGLVLHSHPSLYHGPTLTSFPLYFLVVNYTAYYFFDYLSTVMAHLTFNILSDPALDIL